MAIGYGQSAPKPPKRETKAPTRIRTHRKPKADRDHVSAVRQYIIGRERNVCRCCRVRVGQSMHELIPRSLGGKISRKNSVWLCGDGVNGCHGFLQRREINVHPDETWAEGCLIFTPTTHPAADWMRIIRHQSVQSQPMVQIEALE